MAKIIIVGGSFAGLTAAYELRKRLPREHEITVISNNPEFVFIPSMPWIVLGSRTAADVTFALEPVLRKKGIRFMQDALVRVDPENNVLYTRQTQMPYDYLMLATGPGLDFAAVPGLGPHDGYTQSVCTLDHSLTAHKAWDEFLKNPGPIVVGAAQGASCFGAGYEFLLNVDSELRKKGLRDHVDLTWVTSEPFLGHFGLGGVGDSKPLVERIFQMRGIKSHVSVAIEKVEQNKVVLKDGTELPFAYSMIIPPFKGIEAVFQSPGVGNERGFIPVTNQYRHPSFSNIFAAGVNIALSPPQPTPVPTGVPKTGYMAEHMAKAAAHNIVADILGGPNEEFDPKEMKALCLLDAGDSGVAMIADPVFPPQRKVMLRPGKWVHGAKILFEKYFIWKMRNGLTQLP